jgi:hypothetical protein
LIELGSNISILGSWFGESDAFSDDFKQYLSDENMTIDATSLYPALVHELPDDVNDGYYTVRFTEPASLDVWAMRRGQVKIGSLAYKKQQRRNY